MIRKLKLKLILVNMFLVSVVLISAFAGIYLMTKKNLADRCSVAMHEISKAYTSKDKNDLFSDAIKTENDYSYLSTFAIETDDIRRTFTINGYAIDNDELGDDDLEYLNLLISGVYSSEKSEGVLAAYNLRYYSVNTLRGRRIVFLDKNFEDRTLFDMLIIFSVTGVLTLSLVLVISIIFAGISVEPVERSMAQQKQLVADLSHELKTPITVISANADIIAAHPDSPVKDQGKWLDYIKTESSRMTSLVSNMLFLARNDEAGDLSTHVPVNLSDITYEAALPFESVCFERSKSIEIIADDNVWVKGDVDQLKQLVAVLTDNACKYSAENGYIKVMLKAESDKATLTVWNSGDPIPHSHIDHLFDRFYRIDKSRSRSEGGSGLGLSIAKTIADNHQARLNVVSNADEGTAFICTFKRCKQS